MILQGTAVSICQSLSQYAMYAELANACCQHKLKDLSSKGAYEWPWTHRHAGSTQGRGLQHRFIRVLQNASGGGRCYHVQFINCIHVNPRNAEI